MITNSYFIFYLEKLENNREEAQEKMKSKTKVITALAILAITIFAYWEYVHISCTETSRNFINKNQSDKDVLDVQRMYDLQYTICTGNRGF